MALQKDDPIVGMIVFEVIEAKGLEKMDKIGKSDPYCIVRFGTAPEFRTATIKKTLDPVWKETCKILVSESTRKYNVEIEMWDWDAGKRDDYMGAISFDIAPVFDMKPHDLWIDLTPGTHKEKKKVSGKIHVRALMKDKMTVEKEFWITFAKHFDADNTNSISYMELVALFEAIDSPATDHEIQELFIRGDKDKDNQMSFEEFADLMASDENNLKSNPILKKIIPEGTLDFVWYVSQKLDDHSSIGNIMMERGFYGKVERTHKDDKIMVQDRASGKLVEEKIPDYIRVAMRMMYSTGTGRFAVNESQIKKVLKHLTDKQGVKYNNPASVKEIPHFIAFHGLNMDEIRDPMDSFKNFNEFFFRKLKKTARPVTESDPKVAVSAADCRLNVFPTLEAATKIWIKGKNFTLKTLLGDEKLAQDYVGGSLVISRLAPQDYHRFHCPVDGVIGSFKPIDGTFYTVNPIAIRETVDVYTENKRVRTIINSPQFGNVAFIAVGATMVGSINFTVKDGQGVKRGEELGYFAFGGSTVLVLFKKGTIKFDQDLIVNSEKPLETLVRVGNRLGVAVGK